MNQSTIEQAWKDSQKNLISFIRSKVDTLDDAEDILNDVLVALIITVNNNDAPGDITSWIYYVTKNKIVDYYRSKKRFEKLSEDLILENEDDNVTDQLSSCILPMIKVLPENYQQPLILSEIEGKKYKDVASDLGLSLSAVKSRVLRGRKKLYASMVACCTIQRDAMGNIIDYQQKEPKSCGNCDSR